MKIVVLNSGSSSLKFQLFEMPEKTVICSGIIERIGFGDAHITYKTTDNSLDKNVEVSTHKKGLQLLLTYLLDKNIGVLKSPKEVAIVGHRVVHGGSDFTDTTLITEAVMDKIKSLIPLAPLHNPANLQGILVAEEIFTEAKQVAVFDTAYHHTIPVKAHKYAIPSKFLEEHNIRVYGFHGTSHKYIAKKATEYLDKDNAKVISIHLGNGCSMTAIQNGKSIDHSLGFAPMNGLIMGTRSGDIDPAIIFYMVNTLGYTLEKVSDLLQKESGMLGLTGYSDLRDIEAQAAEGNKDCELALQMNAYRIKKFIGSYIAVMNGVDAIVFTAGIGENSDVIRNMVCTDMETFGIELDEVKNAIRSKNIREINSKDAPVKILIIPTNEELEIAEQSYELLN
ncbi:acetate/propionate family kinase [Aquimarina intermedia]|uniref:Acetate kinase n=1 Tax=Aquimarina intermedia TaxID=350814 RepID=A0A5S5BT74_9FLAO|nr:acetate kinase [Aquimarina intermedia]TYP70381.1 acetate kinase [Aquimarina intermedia]